MLHRVTVLHPAASASYTLRDGDLVTVPAVNLWCDVEHVNHFESIAGRLHPIFYCNRTAPTADKNYVVILRNGIQVWKAGNTLHPVWGKP